MSTVMEAAAKNGKPRHRGKVKVSTITLAHGGGGKAMHDLIDDIFLGAFDNENESPLEDQAAGREEHLLTPRNRRRISR